MEQSLPDRKICEQCGETISSLAQVCPRCRSPLTKSGKWKAKVLAYAGTCASIATALVICFLLWSNMQTKQAIDLQRAALNRTDSTLALVNEQISLMREANDLQRQVNILNMKGQQEQVRAFIEENKPRLDVVNVDAKLEHDSIIVYTNIQNIGKSTAYGVSVQMVGKDSGMALSGQTFNAVYEYISSGRAKVESRVIPIRPNTIVFKISVQWNWPQYGMVDSLQKFFIVRYDSLQNICETRHLGQLQVQYYWSEE